MPAVAPELKWIDFWDVGQADCSVLNFSDNSILLIDTGRATSPVVDWLADRPRTIRSIVLTHNDADHAGGLCPIVGDHARRIESIFMLQDRPKNDTCFAKVFGCALSGEQRGYYKIEVATAGAVVWENQQQDLVLKVIHPSFSEAILSSTANQSSALLVLMHKETILSAWPGDLLLRQVSGKLAGRTPWVMVGPHHGAPSDYKKKPDAMSHVKSVGPARCFVSVGTKKGV